MALLMCQTDAYLQCLTTSVVRADKIPEGYAVVLEQTILYPEGGGQPSDHGWIDGQRVESLARDENGKVIHVVKDWRGNKEVMVKIDWPRRFDHMQQHTAQHLITAIAEDQLGKSTLAFHLQPDICDIDVDGPVSEAQRAELERLVNEVIRQDRRVKHTEVSLDELGGVRTRGMPEAFTGPVRLVEIEGVDINTCGGTHVSSTAQLQSVSLLPPLKHKQGTKLRYLAGQRVLDQLQRRLRQAVELNALLSCGPDEHAQAIGRLVDQGKSNRAVLGRLRDELAEHLGDQLRRTSLQHMHRDSADLSVLSRIVSLAGIDDNASPVLLTGGDCEGAGVFLVAGPREVVTHVGPQIAEILEGRGGGKGTRYQGRAQRLDRADEAVALINRVMKEL